MSKVCPNCQTSNEPGAHFCEECGYPLAKTRKCYRCGQRVRGTAKFCINCGTRVQFFCPECQIEYPVGHFSCVKCGYQFREKSTHINSAISSGFLEQLVLPEQLRAVHISPDQKPKFPDTIPLDNKVSDFLKIEIEYARIKGLTQRKIEKKEFDLKDVEYLGTKAAEFVSVNKPKQAAGYYLSAVKVLYSLNLKNDTRIPTYLRNYCVTKGYVSVRENPNLDVARTYYAEVFRSPDVMFSEEHTADCNEAVPRQSKRTLSLFLSTYYQTKRALLEKSNWSIHTLKELFQTRNEKTIFFALRGLLLIVSYNPEVEQYLLFMAKHDSQILRKLCHFLSQLLYKKPVHTTTLEALENMIEAGVNHIREVTQHLITEFYSFETNLSSVNQIREKISKFLDWNPAFEDAGGDCLETDSRYLARMKAILRLIETYDNALNFDDRESKYGTTIQFMNTLTDDITTSSTYWARAYMQPLLRKWKELVEEDFKKHDEQTAPELRLETVERVEIDQVHKIVTMHVLLGNRQGTRRASGVKLSILPSPEASYEAVEETYDIGTIHIGTAIAQVIQLALTTSSEEFTLNYKISYDRHGEKIIEEPRTYSVKLTKEPFESFANPYLAWANASIVTEKSMFKGRSAFVNDIVDTIKHAGRNKTIAIYGQKRSGKSSILYHVARTFETMPERPFLPIELSLGAFDANLDIPKFFHAVLLELENAVPNTPPMLSLQMLSEYPVIRFINYIRRFKELPEMRNRVLLLLIDEFTYLYTMIKQGYIDESFMQNWKMIIDRHLFTMVLAGTDDMPDFIREYPNAFAATELQYVGYLDDGGARELIADPIWNQQKDISRLPETVVQKIIHLTAGSPFYIQILMNRLVNYMNTQEFNRAIVADVDKVVEEYIQALPPEEAPVLFDNLVSCLSNSDESAKLEKRVLQVIAHLTLHHEYADKDLILQEFGKSEHEQVEKLINRLLARQVLVSRSGFEAYKIFVELLKLWFNKQMPYEKPLRVKNPYIVGYPVTNENFYGRQQEIERIVQNISNNSFLLDAEWRAGKTSLLYKIQYELERLASEKYYFLPVFISLNGCDESDVWERLAEGVYETLHKHLHIEVTVEDETFQTISSRYTQLKLKWMIIDLVAEIHEQLKQTSHNKEVKVIFLIDEAQQINSYSKKTRTDLRDFFSQDMELKEHVRAIVAGYQIERMAGQYSSPWANFMRPIHLEALPEKDIRALIVEPIKREYRDRYHFEEIAIEKIMQYGMKLPFDTQVYCSLAFDEILATGERAIRAAIIEKIKPKAIEQISEAIDGVRRGQHE